LNLIEGTDISFSSCPPHSSQVVSGASENFWIISILLPHFLQQYSYNGITRSPFRYYANQYTKTILPGEFRKRRQRIETGADRQALRRSQRQERRLAQEPDNKSRFVSHFLNARLSE